ncbi:hypothetical protein GCM10007342_19350 [Staphylococcus pragensis]|nr:hypothetical protein GCM10007342_19350 [Staphylococcus pragensis]
MAHSQASQFGMLFLLSKGFDNNINKFLIVHMTVSIFIGIIRTMEKYIRRRCYGFFQLF